MNNFDLNPMLLTSPQPALYQNCSGHLFTTSSRNTSRRSLKVRPSSRTNSGDLLLKAAMPEIIADGVALTLPRLTLSHFGHVSPRGLVHRILLLNPSVDPSSLTKDVIMKIFDQLIAILKAKSIAAGSQSRRETKINRQRARVGSSTVQFKSVLIDIVAQGRVLGFSARF